MSKLEKLVKQFIAGLAETSFADIQYVLEAFGFEEKRSKGSHHIFVDTQGRVLTIPKKGGKKVKRVYVKRVVELLNLEEWQNDIEAEENKEPENNE
jgi:predicted RNA binding protein YcfA (HicA-like mRNA interferase family)